MLVGDTPPFKEDFDPVQLIRQFHGENGTFNTVDLTVEEHKRFVKQWQTSGPVPVSASSLPEFYLETQAAYQAMARAGGGSWRSLTKDEHINQQVLILAFGEEWRTEVAAFSAAASSRAMPTRKILHALHPEPHCGDLSMWFAPAIGGRRGAGSPRNAAFSTDLSFSFI